MTLWKLTWATIKMYFRNKQALFWALFFPLLIMVVFGLMDFEGGGGYRVGVINHSPSPLAQEFVTGISENEELKDVLEITQAGDLEERTALEKGERDVVLILPDSFLANPQAVEPTTIKVLINEGRPQQTGAALSILEQLFTQFENNITQQPKLFNLETESVNSRNLRYIDFLVPGIIAFSLMQVSIFGIVFAVVEYKEKGIMKRLFVTPIKPVDFTLSQVFTRLIVTLMQVVVLVLVAVLLFKVKIIGSYFILAILAILGSTLFLSMGFAIAGIAKTQEAAAPIANIVSFPQMFLANVFFPVEAMPDWLQGVVKYLPLNYLANGIRSVATEGASWSDLGIDFLGLAVWLAITLVLAFKLFSWRKAANE